MSGVKNKVECIPAAPILPPCRICYGKASGFHYGLNTCEACKAFFRRSQKKFHLYKCTKSSNCEIAYEKRGLCSYCRYQKCLNLGMGKHAIKTGRYTHEKKANDIKEVKGLANWTHQYVTNELLKIRHLEQQAAQESEEHCHTPLQKGSPLNKRDTEDLLLSNQTQRQEQFYEGVDETRLQFSRLHKNQQFPNDVPRDFEKSNSQHPRKRHWEGDQLHVVSEGVNLQRDRGVQSPREGGVHAHAEGVPLLQNATSPAPYSMLQSGLNIVNIELTDENLRHTKLHPEHCNDSMQGGNKFEYKQLLRAMALSPELRNVQPCCSKRSDVMKPYQDEELERRSNARLVTPIRSNGTSVMIPRDLDSGAAVKMEPSDPVDSDTEINSMSSHDSSVSPAGSPFVRRPAYDIDQIPYYEDLVKKLIQVYRSLTPHISEFYDRGWPAKEKDYLEKSALRSKVFGSLRTMTLKEYMVFYQETGIDVDGRCDILQRVYVPYIEMCIKRCVNFAKAIPGFSRLMLQDQITLIKTSRFDCWMVSAHTSFNCQYRLFMSMEGEIIGPEDMFKLHDPNFIDAIFVLQQKLSDMKLTLEETCVFSAFVVMFPDHCELKDLSIIDVSQEMLLQCLLYLFDKHHPEDRKRVSKFIDCLIAMRTLREHQLKDEERVANEWSGIVDMPPLFYEVWSS